MDKWTKAKEWINENAPMLAVVYQNKYVGMGYDHFASLPSKQQKQVILGTLGGFFAIIFFYLLWSYISLWSYSSQAKESYSMANLLQQYQKSRRDKSALLQNLEKSSQLSAPGQFKTHLLNQGKAAAISQRMMQVEEKGDAEVKEDGAKSSQDVKVRQATVTLEKINLNQLKSFLNNIEYGSYQMGISSIRILNDDKIRGYMKVELGVVAYLFQSEEGT